MASSPLVSLRIPPETLERIDRLAQNLYPPRRTSGNPNRSQVILDAIEQFLEQSESDSVNNVNVEEQVNKALQQYQKQWEKQIKKYIDDRFLAYAYNLEQRLHPARKVI